MSALKRHALVVTSIIAVALTLPAAASAEKVERRFDYGTISGTCTVHKDVVKYSFDLRDPRANDKAVYARLDLDSTTPFNDIEIKTARTSGGKVKKVRGTTSGINLSGARIFVCEDRPYRDDHCREAAFVPKR